MEIVHHGGKCCGMKTLFGFHLDPSAELKATTKVIPADYKRSYEKKLDITPGTLNRDKYGKAAGSEWPFRSTEKDIWPEETAGERFDRIIKHTCKHRPDHMIECVLTIYQKEYWHDILLANGFNLVTTWKNSNTQNTLYAYHLVISGGKPVINKDDTKKKEAK